MATLVVEVIRKNESRTEVFVLLRTPMSQYLSRLIGRRFSASWLSILIMQCLTRLINRRGREDPYPT